MFQDEDVQGVPASIHAAACAQRNASRYSVSDQVPDGPRERETLVLVRDKRRREMRAFMFYLDTWSL